MYVHIYMASLLLSAHGPIMFKHAEDASTYTSVPPKYSPLHFKCMEAAFNRSSKHLEDCQSFLRKVDHYLK